MKQDVARRAIIAEWDSLRDGTMSATSFFLHLHSHRPDLLNFRSVDKYQAIKMWLLEANRLDH